MSPTTVVTRKKLRQTVVEHVSVQECPWELRSTEKTKAGAVELILRGCDKGYLITVPVEVAFVSRFRVRKGPPECCRGSFPVTRFRVTQGALEHPRGLNDLSSYNKLAVIC